MRISSASIGSLGLLALVAGCSGVDDTCPPGQVFDENGLCALPCEFVTVNCDDGNDCTADGCENLQDGTAECSNVNKADDTTCMQDGIAGWCVSGECDFCAMIDCEDGSACTLDGTCNAATGQCEGGTNAPDGTDCLTGGNPGTCEAGVCKGLCEGVECNDDEECTDDACDPADGECDFTAVEDGTPCDFGDLPGRCTSGFCTDASPPSIFMTVGGEGMTSDQYQMSVSVGGPVGQGTASSPNYTLEFRLPMSQ